MESNSENKSGFVSIRDLLKLFVSLFRLAKQNLKLILLCNIVSCLLGATLAFIGKPIYKSHLSFLLNENETTSLNLSSLAGLAGLGGGNIYSGVNEDKLLFLSSSRFLMGTTLLTEVELRGRKLKLADYFIEKYELQKKFKSDSLLSDFIGFRSKKLDDLTKQENKVLDMVIDYIEKGKLLKVEGKKKAGLVAQNAGIITIDFISVDEFFSKTFVEVLFDNMSNYYVNKSTQRHLRNYNLIRDRADSLKSILSAREFFSANLFDQNVNISKMRAKVNLERNRRDIELLNLMYAEVLKNLEISKFNLENQTPMLQLIDKPTFPLAAEKKSKFKYSLIAMGLANLVLLCVLLIKDLPKKIFVAN